MILIAWKSDDRSSETLGSKRNSTEQMQDRAPEHVAESALNLLDCLVLKGHVLDRNLHLRVLRVATFALDVGWGRRPRSGRGSRWRFERQTHTMSLSIHMTIPVFVIKLCEDSSMGPQLCHQTNSLKKYGQCRGE